MRRYSSLTLFVAGLMLVGQMPGQTPAAKPASKSTAARPKAPPAAKPHPAALTTDDQKIVYSLGATIAQSLVPFDLSPAELDIVTRAITETAAGKPAINADDWQSKIEAFKNGRTAAVAAKRKAATESFVAKALAAPGATKTESGLIYRDITPGTGASPAATDTVKVNYRGTFVDGTEFDSSYRRNQPATFPLNQVIKCWTEGVQKMKVGGKANLICPSDLAYGDGGRPGIPGGSTLVFDVELLDITPAAK